MVRSARDVGTLRRARSSRMGLSCDLGDCRVQFEPNRVSEAH